MKKLNNNQEFTFDDILLLPGKSNYDIGETDKISLKTKISRTVTLDLPIVSASMSGVTEDEMAIAIGEAGGIGFIHPFQGVNRQADQIRKVKKHGLKVAGTTYDYRKNGIAEIKTLLQAGADLISLESSHAHNKQVLNFIRQVKKSIPKVDLSISLLATPEGVRDVIKAGADSVRVGIGGGSHCTTRIVTGVGRPQLSTVMECYKISKKNNIPLISDTGIKSAGDVVKALAFGADAVMIGGMFSGTDECPGHIVERDGKKMKMTWGNCTDTAIRHKQLKHILRKTTSFLPWLSPLFEQEKEEKLFEEGVEKLVPYKGPVRPIFNDIKNGIERSFWYQGVTSIATLKKNAKPVLVTGNTYTENIPRI